MGVYITIWEQGQGIYLKAIQDTFQDFWLFNSRQFEVLLEDTMCIRHLDAVY